MRHEGDVDSAQFSPDGQRVVTASADKTAQVWDAARSKPVGEPIKYEGIPGSAQFSPDGQRVVTASGDKTAQVWDTASGKPIGEPMRHEGDVSSAQFSPDGQWVVTASGDKTARLWSATSGEPVGEPMRHERMVLWAQFTPDSQRVLTASQDQTARLWDAVIVTDKDTREDVLLLAELAKATVGMAMETVGQAEVLKWMTPEHARASREKVAAKFLGPSKLTPLQRVMKWSVSDRKSRTISPFSQVTVSEWLENRIKEGTVEGLRAAMQVDPANARVTAHLGRCLADYALKQGRDPDEARRTRGDADFLTSRALKLAPDNDEVKQLRDEVVRLLELKTN
jgi:dipeptidyl aminopeptidase/acylaminoacyl peptidase